MEFKLLKNTRTNRIILVDKTNGMAFVSYGKEDKEYKYFMQYHSGSIEDYKPTT
jgi:hypothetical protein